MTHRSGRQASTPVWASVGLKNLDRLARRSIDFETRKSAGMSFAAGLPGGFAMLATVPADVTQYYVHAFRIMQKLTYLYGWQDLLGDLEDADDETIGWLALFLGVMLGVGGAATSLTSFAQHVARPALQKQITKDSLAKTVTKVVPGLSVAILGGMTLVMLKSQADRPHMHLRELPPPRADAAAYTAAALVSTQRT